MSHRLGPFPAEWVLCSCGQKFQRAAGETCVTCLSCQTAGRLAAAGIRSDDPALVVIRAYNAEARRRASPAAEEPSA
jgi:hypothetical protein